MPALTDRVKSCDTPSLGFLSILAVVDIWYFILSKCVSRYEQHYRYLSFDI